MDYKGKRVFVLDGFGRQVATILQQLHGLGCVVTTLNDSKYDIGNVSRYPKKRIIVNGIREDEALLEHAILNELASEKYDVVFPMIEKSTDVLTRLMMKGELKDTKVISAPREAFLKAYDKQLTLTICQENGIPCPITKMDDETVDEYLEKVRFPLACKPRKGTGSTGFKKVENKEQLYEYINRGVIKPEEYVIQEYIPHTDYHYGAYVMMDKNSEPVYCVVVQSCRQYPVDGGPGCYIRTVNDPEVQKNVVSLFKKMNWVGFGHVGLIMDPADRKAKVMEINGRIPGGVKICHCVGIPSVKIMLDLVYDQPITNRDYTYPDKIALRHSQADILWLLKSPYRFKATPSWFNFHHNNDYVFSWRDPLPWFSYSIEHMLTYKKDMKKREH